MDRPPRTPSTARSVVGVGGRARNLERRFQGQTVFSRYSNEIINDPVGGLVLYWKLDELGNTTTDAVDSSGNGHTGTYGVSPAHPTLGVAALADGTAAEFDGVNDIVSIGTDVPAIQAFGHMSIEFWTKTTQNSILDGGIATLPAIISSDTGGSGGRFFKVWLDIATGQIEYAIFDTAAFGHSVTGAAVVNDGAKHHVVCTFDGTDLKIYVDGALDATATPSMAGQALSINNHGFWVGSGAPIGGGFFEDAHFKGVVDEVALYTVALPLSSVQTHYLVGGTASNPPGGTVGGIDVVGTYPDGLELVTFGPGAVGPIGDSTHVAAVSTDAKGRVSALSSVAIAFPSATDVAVSAAPGSDDTASGIKIDLTAGETVAFGDPVYIKSDGKVWKADADTTTTYPAVGLAIGSAAANATVTVLLFGIARHDAWNWTVGGIVYLSTSSGLTQTQPSATDNAIQVIGIAPHADRLFVNPQLVYITHT